MDSEEFNWEHNLCINKMAILLAYAHTGGVLTPTTTASGVGGSTAINGSLSSFATGSGLGYATEPVVIANPTSGATSATLAVTNSSNFSFAITPNAGNSISLTTLTFNIARGGAATPRGYDVRSSADGYATTLGTAAVATTRPNWTAVSIDLSGASFQSTTSTITFRIYIYAPSTVNSLDIDDIVLNGTVASSGTVEQEGFRFRADDGSEITATGIAAQDTNIIREKNTNTRLRVVLNSTLDRGSESYRLEVRRVGDSTWSVVT